MIISRKKGNLTEIRGITYIKNGDTDWKRHLFLSKFFNINQSCGSDVTIMKLTINGNSKNVNINTLYAQKDNTIVRALDLKVGVTVGEYDRATETVGKFFVVETIEKEIMDCENKENSWMYDDVKHLEISKVANKEDGSAIRFLLINGVLIAKTKFSLESEQADLAMSVVNSNKQLKDFILKTLETNLAALFEIVSPMNKIVLSYNETSLRLLQLRDENTGKYFDIYNHSLVKEYDVLCAKSESLTDLKKVASSYTKEEIINTIGERKFNSLEEFLNFLKK